MFHRSIILVSLALLLGARAASAAGVSIAANDPLLRYTGRFDHSTPTSPRFAWPGVSIEAAFSGTSVGIRLAEQSAYTNYFDATIDGGVPRRITSSSTSIVTHSITGLSPGNHSLRLLRRGESFNGASSGQEHSLFHGLDLDAGAGLLALPPRPVRRIEVLGDSLSVGYGNEGPGLSCPGTVPQYTNNALAYGSLTALTFCAEVHSTAISGHGLLANYGDGIASAYPLPALFDRALPGSASPAWDFNSWQPDAVVIFLGTNDFSTGSAPPNAPSQASYEAAYHALIADIRARYAATDPWIFCLHHTTWDGSGMFDFGPYVSSVVAYQNGTLGDAKVFAVDMDPYSGSACDYHPSVAEDQAMAARLRVAIAAATGWVPGSCPSVSTPTPTPTLTPTATACGACTATDTPTASPTPGGAKLYCLSIDYSAVPALVNERKLTLKVSVGSATSVDVQVDGTSTASTYASGIVTFSTTGTDVVISANGWSSGGTGVATKALLYDDHHWAHSLTFDDGIKTQYDNARPVLAARGLRAGIALNASGIVGGNGWNMSWAEAQALRAAGWDVFNHSYSHPTISCANFATEFQQNQTLFQAQFPGYNVSHIVYPFEDTSAAACAGWPPNYILSGEGGGGLNYVDAAFPNVYRLYRNGLYGAASSGWQASAASAAGNARPSWLITITHSVAAGSSAPSDAYSTNADTLAAYLDYVNNTFGAGGDNTMWFAPSGEVYDYILTRDNATVSSVGCGTPTPTPTICGACTATATVTVTSTRTVTLTATPTPPCAPFVFDAMDDNNTQNNLSSYWFNYAGTGTSTVNPAVFAMSGPGYGGTGYCARLYGNADAGGPPSVGSSLPTSDLSAYSGFTFWFKGEGKAVRFQIHSGVQTQYNDYKYDFTPPVGWSLITVPWASLSFPGWGPAYSLDTQQIVALSWVPMNSGAYDFSVDEVSFTCAGASSPTPTVTATRTRTPSPSMTATASGSATPSGTPSASATASPVFSVTASPTTSPIHSPTASPTATLSSTESPSFTPSPSSTQSPQLSPTPSATLTLTPSITPSVTLTATDAPTALPTASFTPAGTATPSPGADGPLVILGAVAFPQPNPQSVRVNLQGAADRCELRLYSSAYTCVGRYLGPGAVGAGWVSVPMASLNLPSGSYFYEVRAERGSVHSKPAVGRLVVLR